VGQDDSQRPIAQQLAQMLMAAAIVFQGHLRREASEQVRMEFGADPFSHEVIDGLADLGS
jgi:hypothetical protein